MRDFLAAASAAVDVRQLWAAFTDYFGSHGINNIAILHFVQKGTSDPLGSWAMARGRDDWARHYVDGEMMASDPVRAHATVSSVPFLWSDVYKLRPVSPEEDRAYQEMSQYHPNDGLAVPVFGPSGRNGYVVMAFPSGFALSSCLLVEFRVVAQFAHQCSCELVARTGSAVLLSPREQEVLSWMARGKSNGVIADIIGVSTNTVDTHVRRIFVKLQVSDRVSAALIGMGHGLISQE